jgi:hypothetical protein
MKISDLPETFEKRIDYMYPNEENLDTDRSNIIVINMHESYLNLYVWDRKKTFWRQKLVLDKRK